MVLSRLAALGRSSYLFLVFAYLLGPTVVVLVISLGRDSIVRFPPRLFSGAWYHQALTDPAWTTPALRSLIVGVCSSLLATAAGTAAAIAIVRGELPGRRTIELSLLFPLIVPPITIAVGGYGLFVDLHLAGSLFGLTLIYAVLAMPIVLIVTSAALYRLDETLDLASASLGASEWQTIWRITLPLIVPAMLTGAIFALLASFDELVIALFLVGTSSPTLPLRIYSGITFGVSPTVAAVSSLLVASSLVGLGLIAILSRDRQGRARPAELDLAGALEVP